MHDSPPNINTHMTLAADACARAAARHRRSGAPGHDTDRRDAFVTTSCLEEGGRGPLDAFDRV